MKYKLTNTHPVARFYYKGSHSHPIRRTVLIIESDAESITGYEVREGNITRKMIKAPVKTYLKSKMAKYSQLGYAHHRLPGPKKSTLRRTRLYDFLIVGP